MSFPMHNARLQTLFRGAFALMLTSAVLILYYMCDSSMSNLRWKPPPPPKRILFWTTYWKTHKPWRSLFPDLLSGQCPGLDCIMVYNHSELSRADAVVFNLNSLDLNVAKLPVRQRPPGQLWVLFSVEAPTHDKVRAIDLKRLNGLFNWTMTYRWDSDVPMPYGLVVPAEAMSDTALLTSLPDSVRQALSRRPAFGRPRPPGPKKHLVSWMVSKCKSPGKREKYVLQLKKHVQVDVYGKCGKLKCGRRDIENIQNNTEVNKVCEETIADSKFYLALENAICPEYATEKLFRTMRLGTVPIVFGGYDYARLLPEGSYIDALQYDPEQLGKLLLHLDSNDTAYSEFFRWQDHFHVLEGFPHHSLSCGLCQKLHQLPLGATVGSHTALHRWFGAEQCSKWRGNQTRVVH